MFPYQWIVFDADNTLFDYHRAEKNALHQTLKSQDIDLTTEVQQSYAKINNALWKRFEQGELTSLEIRVQRFVELKQRWNFEYHPERVSTAYLTQLAKQAVLIPGARSLLIDLKSTKYYRLALATNGIADVQRGRLEKSGLESYFEAVIISDEIGASKPAEQYFSILFEQIGNPLREQVLMVGDSLSSDITGGNRFGIDTCWINRNSQTAQENSRPTYEIQDLLDLRQILGI